MAKAKTSKRLSNVSTLTIQRGMLIILLVGLVICGLTLIYQSDGSGPVTPDAGTAIEDAPQDVEQSNTNAGQGEEE